MRRCHYLKYFSAQGLHAKMHIYEKNAFLHLEPSAVQKSRGDFDLENNRLNCMQPRTQV